MDYRGIFEDAVDALRQERRYRVFADLKRVRGQFPQAAIDYAPKGCAAHDT